MARKPVLSGGKRDEIIATAMKLFFENGYEATSVRTIMNAVGGEIGMFYHYFKSKDMLFDQVVEKFFADYKEKFEAMLSKCETREDFIKTFIPMYEKSMEEFGQIQGNVHWTVQAAMHDGTLTALKPGIEELIPKWNAKNETPAGILAAQLLNGISATLHAPEFEAMSTSKKKKVILDYINRILD